MIADVLLVRDTLLGTIADRIAADFQTLPVAYPNQPFDWTNPPPRYLTVALDFEPAQQATLALENPRSRRYGCLDLAVYSRAGTGDREGLRILAAFSAQLQYARVPTGASWIRFQAAGALVDQEAKGWFRQTMSFPFFLDMA